MLITPTTRSAITAAVRGSTCASPGDEHGNRGDGRRYPGTGGVHLGTEIPAIFVESSVPPATIEAVQEAAATAASTSFRRAVFSDAMGAAGTGGHLPRDGAVQYRHHRRGAQRGGQPRLQPRDGEKMMTVAAPLFEHAPPGTPYPRYRSLTWTVAYRDTPVLWDVDLESPPVR